LGGAPQGARLEAVPPGFVVTGMFLLAVAVTVPFSLASGVADVLGLPTGKVFPTANSIPG